MRWLLQLETLLFGEDVELACQGSLPSPGEQVDEGPAGPEW